MTAEEAPKPPPELLSEVTTKKELHHTKAGPKSVTGLLSEVRQVHGEKEKVLKKAPGTVDKQTLLSEVRKDAGKKEVLHHAKVPPKSVTAVMSEVREKHGAKDELKKAHTVDKQGLLQEVRSLSQSKLDVSKD